MQKELLSAYVDGELVNQELTQKLCQDVELQQSWAAYHTIRSVIRQETPQLLGADFTAKMAMLIETEEMDISQPTISQPTPEEVAQSPFMQKLKAMFAPLTQVAVAAGVCLAVVLGTQNLLNNQHETQVADTPVLQTLPFNNGVREVSYNAPSKDVATPEQLEQKNKRLGAMLQNYELQRRIYADKLNLDSAKQ